MSVNPLAQDDRTEVCISIDTEFSIAGHFDDPERYQPLAEPVVYCREPGVPQPGHGVEFLLNLFETYGVKATFFVECANYYFFGDQPMQGVVNLLKQHDQDIQLHVHPVWLSFIDDHRKSSFPRNDDCTHRSFEGLKAAFQECMSVFERWVGERPLAVRTGSLRVDSNVYDVLSDLKIPMSSNVALGIFEPTNRELHHLYGKHNIAGVNEYPVFTYQDSNVGGYQNLKSLQITSCSWPEMRCLLQRARAQGVRRIVLLTHPFEYAKKSDFQYTKLTRNRVNKRRLERLCQFVQENDQDFAFTSFSQMHASANKADRSAEVVTMPWYYRIHRKLQNKLNDLVWAY